MKTLENEIKIRTIHPEDLTEIYKLGEQNFLNTKLKLPWTPENIADIIQQNSQLSITVTKKNKIIGFIIGAQHETEVYIHWILILEKFRKKGLGKKLITKLMQESKENGALNFFVDLNINSTDTINFFNKIEFAQSNRFIELKSKQTLY